MSAPAATPTVQLGAVCREARQLIDGQTSEAKALPYIGLENIESQSGRITQTAANSGSTAGAGATFRFGPQHVLYGKLRPYLNKVALPDFEGRCTTEIIPLLPDTRLDRRYLAWLLRTAETVHYMTHEVTGSRMPRADVRRLLSLEIPLPDPVEQRHIVEIIDRQMVLVDKTKLVANEQMELLNALVEGYLREILATSPSVDIPLSDCLEEITTGIGTDWQKFRVLGATRDGIAPAKEQVGKNPERYKPVVPGTIFYNPMRILIGSIAMLGENEEAGITSPDYVVFRTREGALHHRFFYCWLRSSAGAHFIRRLARGAVRERLLFKRLRSARISLPPLASQLAFAAKNDRISAALRTLRLEIEAIRGLRSKILTTAFARG